MKGFFQILNLIFLFLIVLLGIIYLRYSESADQFRDSLELTFYLFIGLTPVLLIIYGILSGKLEDKTKIFITAYRQLLTKNIFLWIANTLFAVIIGVFIYNLVFFRQVEFALDGVSKAELEGKTITIGVTGYNEENKTIEIGDFKSDETLKRRLPIGIYSFQYTNLGESKIVDGNPEFELTMGLLAKKTKIVLNEF
ncbi:MAG: hypothetical protein ACI8ZM_003620 [Crocinitomix sp.]|jgi:hypothetical protein